MATLKFKVDVQGWDDVKEKVAMLATDAEHKVATQVMRETNPFVPAKNLILAGTTRVIGNTIVYPGPYARYLYFGKLEVDPDTGSAWASYGKKKVETDKNLVFNTTVHAQAQSHWFEASKAQNLSRWLKYAQEVLDGKH